MDKYGRYIHTKNSRDRREYALTTNKYPESCPDKYIINFKESGKQYTCNRSNLFWTKGLSGIAPNSGSYQTHVSTAHANNDSEK